MGNSKPLTVVSTENKISVATLRRAIQRGDLTATKGERGRYELTDEAVAEYLAEHRQPSVMAPEQLRAWAREVAAAAPPVTPELAREVTSILTSGRDKGMRGVAA
ncbi:MAG: hypothetical protein ACI38U_07735 [Corynebacterium sp.]|uniref:hypothetical protein n=1 Tax=Corynebacterium sp. TaxID=1720 RepID=UPI003F0EA17F